MICVETIALLGKDKMKFDPESNHSVDSGGPGPHQILYGFRAYTDYDPDDNKSDPGSIRGESLPGSRGGSVASRDYSAWPDREIPQNFLKL